MAKQLLAEQGELYPIGFVMKPTGEVVNVAVWDGHDYPTSKNLIADLTATFKRKAAAGDIIAAAICFDVTVTQNDSSEKTDALQISLEHQSGETAEVFIPYIKAWLNKIKYGEAYKERRTPAFFLPSDQLK